MEMAAATRPSGPVLSIPNYGSASLNRIKLSAAVGARSPAKSVSFSSSPASSPAAKSRRSCMCSPTNHPGSFRCSLHKELKPAQGAHSKPAPYAHSKPDPGGHAHAKPASPPSPPPSAVVYIGSGARVLARRAIAPSQQSQNRRRVVVAGSFRPQPSRLSAVSFAGDTRD